MAYRFLYSLYGLVLGTLIPSGWFLWRAFSTRKKWWLTFFESEMKKNGEVYLVLAISAILIFGLVGFWIGKRRSDIDEESETIKDANIELEQLATTDGLTGLFNVRYMHERLAIEMENSLRSPLSCLLIDIDHFKQLNDKHGHPFGDAVLVHLAKVMKKAVRLVDVVGRIGGEEFVIVLPDTPGDRAHLVAERLRETVAAQEFDRDGKAIRITISVGIVTLPSENIKGINALLKAVDDALYSAKKAGRNRVYAWNNEAA